MKVASLTEFKNKLSAYIDMVKSGQILFILDHGQAVAQISRPISYGATVPFPQLERQGMISRPSQSPPTLESLRAVRLKPRTQFSAVESLILERSAAR